MTGNGEELSNGGLTKKDAVQEGAHQACVGGGKFKRRRREVKRSVKFGMLCLDHVYDSC